MEYRTSFVSSCFKKSTMSNVLFGFVEIGYRWV